MKKIYIIAISLIVIATIATTIWLCQITYSVNVPLFRNIFQNEGYNIENKIEKMPFEILLSDFIFDSTYTTESDAPYVAKIYVQPYNNDKVENLEEIVLHPYETKVYKKYRLYIEEFSYNPNEDNLYITITVEQRRYQTLW